MEASLISLDLGDPGFSPPNAAIAGAVSALKATPVSYGPPQGLKALRIQLGQTLTRRLGLTIDPEHVLITAGASGGLAAALGTLTHVVPRRTLAIPDPGFPAYTHLARLFGWEVRYYPCPASLGYLPDLAALAGAAANGASVILLSSPANPTGAVFPQPVLAEIARIAAECHCWLLSDEAYAGLSYEEPDSSIASTGRNLERVLVVGSFSKLYGLAGWRIGYLVAAPEHVSNLAATHWALTMGASTLSQRAALGALRAEDGYRDEVLGFLRVNRDLAASVLRDANIPVTLPMGGLFFWVPTEPLRLTGSAFALRARSAGVAVQDGGSFGPSGRMHVRVSFARDREEVRAGFLRLARAWVEARHGAPPVTPPAGIDIAVDPEMGSTMPSERR